MYKTSHTFLAASLAGRMAWSYQSVCAIGSLPVSNGTKNKLVSVFRLWYKGSSEPDLSDFALNHLIQANGRLMPFFRFAARYETNRSRWRIDGLGDRGEEELIKVFKSIV